MIQCLGAPLTLRSQTEQYQTGRATNASPVVTISLSAILSSNLSTELKRYTGVLFYSLGQASLRFLAKLFDLSAAKHLSMSCGRRH